VTLENNVVDESTELVVAQAGQVSVHSFIEDAGAGFEDMGASDVAMPFLSIIQKGSPQVDDANAEKFIAEARPGMILNTLTGQLYDGKAGIEVVVCGYKKLVTEWTPRDSGGGFKGIHAPDSAAVANATLKDGKLRTSDGTIMVDTAYYFLLYFSAAEKAWLEAVASMASTQLKASRRLNSLMRGVKMMAVKDGKPVSFTPPMFSHKYLFKTIAQKNDRGSWHGWDISSIGPIADPTLYQVAKDFHSSVASGKVQAGPPPADNENAHGVGSDIPF
jgi:hypothetical protein